MSVIPQHPLVPLTLEEINAIAPVIRADPRFPKTGCPDLNNTPVFARVQLKEPNKNLVLAFNRGEPVDIPRLAKVQVYEPVTNKTHIFTALLVRNPDLVVTVVDYHLRDVIPAMDQYILQLDRQWPVWQVPNGPFKAPTVSDEILDPFNRIGRKVLKLLKARGITEEDLMTGRVRPDYLGGFESFRKTKDDKCAKCCGELIEYCEVHHRFSTVFFRFFAGSEEFDTARRVQTPVYNTPGSFLTDPNPPVANANGVGQAYYDSLGRLEGLLVQVDLTERKLTDIIDFGFEVVPDVLPDQIFRPAHHWQTPINPLQITMPQGPSYRYDQNTGLIQFDNWQMRLSWDHQNGVQLYNVTYSDTAADILDRAVEVQRSVLYKASVSEDLVSYSVGSPMFRRNFTSADSSFYPILRRLIPLVKGVHVPANAQLISIPLCGRNGPVDLASPNSNLQNVVAIFERDADLLTMATGASGPATRGREVVVRTIFSGLFYLWIFDWIFQQDGTIRCEVQVSGRLAVSIRYGQPESEWGEYITKNYLGLLHNHIYAYRFDFDIDGVENTVEQEEIVPVNNVKECPQCCQNVLTRDRKCLEDKKHKDSKEKKPCCKKVANPCGHAGRVKETHFHTELEAVSDVNPQTNRLWVVKNPHSQLRFKNTPRGYAVMPRVNGSNIAQDWSWLNTHLGYTKHNFFVTPYQEDEQYASGEFPILAGRDTGLGSYIKQDRDIEDKDVVCWYVVAFAHSCHSEDWPYITLAPQGVNLVPHFFFEWNPATTLDQRINAVDV
jgi:primary-amine oxidase